MKQTFLLLALAFTMAVSAATTVSVDNQKIVLSRDGQTTILAPNGQDESYYWVSLSPDGTQILYSTAHHGTCVCDLQGHVLRNLGRLNAPKWMDNENVSGMQEHYSEIEHDLVDYTKYYSVNLTSMHQRVLTKAETKEFIRLENERLAEQERDNIRRAAQRRAVMGTSLQGLKIYVNAGHGGHDPNDRSCWTVPIPETWSNPNGYWESNSNLVKALALRDLLEAAGATVIMSRVTNNSGSRDIQYYSYAPGTPEYNAIMAGDDRDLSAIAEEANANHVDHFLSIHSNALNGMTNYLLLLYHGENNRPTVATSDAMAASSGAIQIQNKLTVWTSPAPLLRGDITFYGDSPNDPYAGLGVLRPLTVPGFLSEGSFHDYAPETHRLCNADYCKVEAIRFFQHFHRYFSRALPQTATISGWVKSSNERVDVLGQPKFVYVAGSDDQWLPLNGAKVVLINDAGQRIDSLVTDDWYNGIFAFYDLQPGTYSIEASLTNYKTETQTVTVAAEDIAGVKMFLKNTHMDVPDYPDPEQDPGTLPLDKYEFQSDGAAVTDNNSEFIRAINKGQTIVTLGVDGIVRRNWNFNVIDTIPMPAGLTISDIQDIAMTADEYLMACALVNGHLDFYVWDDEFRNPTLFYHEGTINVVTDPGHNVSMVTKEPLWKVEIAFTANGHAYEYVSTTGTLSDEGTVADNTRLTLAPNKYVMGSDAYVPGYFRYAGHSYIVAPVNGNPGAGFAIHDISDTTNISIVSDSIMLNNTSTGAFALAYVDGYTIHIGLLGVAGQTSQYGRWSSIVTPVANIYAGEVSFDGTNFKFRLNENATSVFLSIEKEGEMKDGVELGAMLKGVHEIPNPFGTQGFDAYSITAKARAVGYPVKISNSDPVFQFYAPRGVAVDRTPSSPFFGRIYVSESMGGQVSEGVAPVKRTTTTGIYVLSSDFQDVTNQGTTAWNGNVTWGANNAGTQYQFALARFGVAPSGKVFVTSTAFSSANVYIMDAANPSADFVPVFGGKRNSETGALKSGGVTVTDPVMSCVVLGEGAEEKLYTMNRNCSGTVYTNIHQYNIGEVDSLPWKQAPTAVVFADNTTNFMENGSGEIAYDGNGGWFMSQYRYSSTTAKPALIHVNADGEMDYNYGPEIATSQQGGMAVNPDGTLLAIGRESGTVAVYDITYLNGIPGITEKYVIEWGSGNTMSVDFDAAGNLYIVSNTNERLMIYSLPKQNNSYTTRISYHQQDTGVENVKNEENNVQKVLRNGQVLILKDGRTYNALGVEIR